MQPNAVRLIINGTVQGVGFRPTIYKVATEMGLRGWVKNTSLGVEVVISKTSPGKFLSNLNDKLPHLAAIDSVVTEAYTLSTPQDKFVILPSIANSVNDTQIPPDSNICQACLNEVFDPKSRYYLYPFTNCANCGPRYTLINNLPYDRINTGMNEFKFCLDCSKEYNDSTSRRYHAETTSCPACGPQFDIELAKIADYINQGKIVALKTVGGYVLIADAKNQQAVDTLRQRKRRTFKPFALMALNTASIRRYFAKINEIEIRLLESAAAPIVILQSKKQNALPKSIAPGLNSLGFMLAYNPIYYLLFFYLLGQPSDESWLTSVHNLALVVTSANLSGDVLISEDETAKEYLQNIADYVVGFNRKISIPCDDSVVMVVDNYPILIRRGRGYAPKSYYLNRNAMSDQIISLRKAEFTTDKTPEVLALGCNSKNTVCFIRDNKAYLSQHLGDMNNISAIEYFHKIINHYTKIYGFKPQLVVGDLHPDFYVSHYAQNLGIEYLQLQHHHAHLCSVIASCESLGHNFLEPLILGCILDGYGYGNAGESLGGELILFNRQDLSFSTLSQLPSLAMPGGDTAEKEPWRLALGLCIQYNLEVPPHLLANPQVERLSKLIANGQFGTTTSLGRLFSGVAALLDIINYSDYEAQAALTMESLVTTPNIDFKSIYLTSDGSPDFELLIKKIYQLGIINKDLVGAVNTFYGSLAALIEKWIIYQASLHGIRQVAISGGCWQSRYLFGLIQKKFKHSEIELLLPQNLPFNDEGISFGQAWYGAMKTKVSNIL